MYQTDNLSLESMQTPRDYYRGKSIRFRFKWTANEEYFNDNWVTDFVSFDNGIYAAINSHVSTVDNGPTSGVSNNNWDFIMGSIHSSDDLILLITSLQKKLDALQGRGAIRDSVKTYADLLLIDTSNLNPNDSYIVESDETHNGNTVIYAWNDRWNYAGSFSLVLNATNATYDNSESLLLSTNVQAAIDEINVKTKVLNEQLGVVISQIDDNSINMYRMDLNSQINNNTSIFVLSEPVQNSTLIWNGVVMMEGVENDYTIDGTTLTTHFIPVLRDNLWITYWK